MGNNEGKEQLQIEEMSVKVARTKLVKQLIAKGSPFVHIFDRLFGFAKVLLGRIPVLFPDFTPHGIAHAEKVITNLDKLLPDAIIKEMSQRHLFILLTAALFHDVGKAATAQWEFKRGRMVITNNAHDITGERITKEIFDRFKIFSWNGYNLRKLVLALVRNHHRSSEIWANRDVVTKKAFNRLAVDMNGEIELLVYLDAADRAGRDEAPIQKLDKEGRWLLQRFEEFNVSKETIQPLIQGRDLIEMGVSPGPVMGKILKKLYQLQLDNEFETRPQGLKIARKIIK